MNKVAKIAMVDFIGKENVEETELRIGAEDFDIMLNRCLLASIEWV